MAGRLADRAPRPPARRRAALRRDRRHGRRATAGCRARAPRGRVLTRRAPAPDRALASSDELLIGDRLKRQPVQRRHAEPLDRLAVLGRRVADVLGELPARMARVGAAHVAVARLLGDHRGGRDRGALGVAADHRALLVAERRDREAVAEADAALAGDRASASRSAARLVTCSPRASIPGAQRETIATFAATRRITGYSSARRLRGLLLGVVQRAERARPAPGPSRSRSNSTAAATSGPARQPRPASSAPATNRTPERAVELDSSAPARPARPRVTPACRALRTRGACAQRKPIRSGGQ